MILTAYDSVTQPYTTTGPVIGYIDSSKGNNFHWAPSSLRAPNVIGRITVLANEMGEIFDLERGNAGWLAVQRSIIKRGKYGLPSIIYCNIDTLKNNPGLVTFIANGAMDNVYLWIADWESVNGPNGQRMGAGDVSYPVNEVFHNINLNNRTVGWQWASRNNHDTSIIDTVKWPLHIDPSFLITPNPPVDYVGKMTLGGNNYSIVKG